MLAFYNIDDEFTELLRNNVDRRVSKNNNVDYKRAYCGIIVSENNNKFFIPMTHKIDDNPSLENTVFMLQRLKKGKRVRDIGMLLFNNAIPVKEGTYTMVDTTIKVTDSNEEKKYKCLLQTQLKAIRKYEEIINFRFNKLLERKKNGKLSKIEETRTCNFDALFDYIRSKSFAETEYSKKLNRKIKFEQLQKKQTPMKEYLNRTQKGEIKVAKPKGNTLHKKVQRKF